MEIKIQISDSVYQTLVAGGCRIQGSIGLVNPTEGNFHEHRRWTERPGTRFIRLPHGRASVSDKGVRLTLNIDNEEAAIVPSDAIIVESRTASDFVDDVFDNMIGY
jgi:hypothetical protein